MLLERDFFAQPTLEVAKNLIGKKMVFGSFEGFITETECYCGDDRATHGSRGKTKRTEAMFLEAGHIYVYLIYGMYHCLNIVTERVGYPSAVLIRGLYLSGEKLHLDGPGKLCRYLGIDLAQNKLLINQEKSLSFFDGGFEVGFEKTPRVGISKAKEKLWRFVVPKNSLKNFVKKNLN